MRRRDRIVYMATNKINGKCYIGYCVSFNERISRHFKCAEKGIDTRFYRAIRKYGKENFIWEKIAENISSIIRCKEIEKEMIRKYNTYEYGYNSTLGGDGGFTGHNSGEFKKGIKAWNKGVKYSDSLIEILKKADRSKSYKPVLQYDLKGNFIKEWKSVKDVKLKYNFLVHTVASDKYPNRSAYGFMWKYKNGKTKTKISPIPPRKYYNGTKIVQMDLKGNLIKVWKNAYTVYKVKGFSAIAKCLNGTRKTSYNFKWKYFNN